MTSHWFYCVKTKKVKRSKVLLKILEKCFHSILWALRCLANSQGIKSQTQYKLVSVHRLEGPHGVMMMMMVFWWTTKRMKVGWVHRTVQVSSCPSWLHPSLSTLQLVWAAGREDRGKLHPPNLWGWRPVTPVASRSWWEPYLLSILVRRTWLMTACKQGTLPVSWPPETQQCERWTRS